MSTEKLQEGIHIISNPKDREDPSQKIIYTDLNGQEHLVSERFLSWEQDLRIKGAEPQLTPSKSLNILNGCSMENRIVYETPIIKKYWFLSVQQI